MGPGTSLRRLVRATAWGGLLLAIVAAVGCGGSSSPTRAGTETTEEPAPSVNAAPPLVGEWQRTTTCTELLRALKQAGLEEFALEAVAGNGFVPGVRTPDQVADPARPCKGAVPRKHSHFFTENGQFGSLDWNGEQVDDGTYEIVDDRTFVVSKEFPDVTFHYRIDGDTIMFDPVIQTDDCSAFRCVWSVAVAYPGKKWQRVG